MCFEVVTVAVYVKVGITFYGYTPSQTAMHADWHALCANMLPGEQGLVRSWTYLSIYIEEDYYKLGELTGGDGSDRGLTSLYHE